MARRSDPHLNRAAFLGGSLAASATLWFPRPSRAAGPEAQNLSPDDALDRLMAGNRRFVKGDLPNDFSNDERRQELVSGQAPFAAILACADSRVLPNLIFVQGLGDLFVIRVAGNFPDDLTIGSIEYSVEHLGSRLIMVLGHERCGAVQATYDAIATKTVLPPHLATIQALIRPGIERVVHDHGSLETAVIANVRTAVETLQSSQPVIAKGVSSHHIRVVGAEYHLATGAVSLVD